MDAPGDGRERHRSIQPKKWWKMPATYRESRLNDPTINNEAPTRGRRLEATTATSERVY